MDALEIESMIRKHQMMDEREIDSMIRMHQIGPAFHEQPYNEDEVVVAVFDFEPRSYMELGFSQNDRMVVIRMEGDEWLLARHEATGRQGFVHINYVAPVESLNLYEWYFGGIHRVEAEFLLRNSPEGTFLIRDSVRNPGDYALSVKHFSEDRKTNVRHFVIKYSNYKYSIWNKLFFSTLHDLVEEYKVNKNGLPLLLGSPCPRIEPTMYELSVETKDEWEIDRSEITLHTLIGSGNFGEVYYGKWKGKIDVAVKTLKKGSMPDDQFLEEAKIMKGLRHDNILSLLATCSKDEPIFIITQFMKNGSLLSVLRQCKSSDSLSDEQMLEFGFQISKGMFYLERKNLMHRDLAARNVLVDDRFTCKIADFGLAKIIQNNEFSVSSCKFPVKWSPPEVLMEGKFSIKSDIWSFGIVMIEIFTYGDPLYPGMNQNQVKAEVINGYRISRPSRCPQHIYEVLLKCWDHNPAGRPFFRDLKDHLEKLCYNINAGTQYLQEMNENFLR